MSHDEHPTPQDRIGERLVAVGAITAGQRDATLTQQRRMQAVGQSIQLGELLLRNRFCDASAINAVLSRGGDEVPERGVGEPLLAPADCVRLAVRPVEVQGSVLLVKAARAVSPAHRAQILRACTVPAASVRVQLVDRHEMHRYLNQQRAHDSFGVVVESLRGTDPSPTVLRAAIDALLHEAIDRRASDIHIDAKPDPDAWISLRIDAELRQCYLLSDRLMAAVVSRMKTLAGMDASSRKAQDGNIGIEHRGRLVKFRMATQSLDGDSETVTLRVNDAASLPTVEALFPNQPYMCALLRRIAAKEGKAGGLVLMTGPTGSGKSTTLYSLAALLPRDARNVITVDDPIEFVLPFARQIQLQQLRGDTTLDMERSLLRQDPDVIVVGEIRDADSAIAAVRFAKTGHLVLATLHGQGNAQSIERFLSMLPSSERAAAELALGTTLVAVISQLLFKSLCSSCSLPADSVPEALEQQFGAGRLTGLRRAVGCPRCEGSGYRGRVALHETTAFEIGDGARDAAVKRIAKGESMQALLDAPGVLTVRRPDVAAKLMEAGLMDAPTVLRALNAGVAA